MKVTCNRERLREALAVVNNVVPIKSPRPAVENLLLSATDGALELVGTDMEVSIRFRILGGSGVDIAETGTALIPARVASDFVRDLDCELVVIEANGDRCAIRGGDDHCELPIIDPEEFPPIMRFESKGAFALQGGTFSKLVHRTIFAAAKEQGRYAMHGVLIELAEDAIKFVATDGRRLAITKSPLDTRALPPRRAIVPTKGLSLFSRVVREPLANIEIQFTENQMGLKARAVVLPDSEGGEPRVTEEIEAFARLIEGEFPKYTTVIPNSSENSVEAETDLLTRKLRLVANVTSAETRAVKLSFGKGELEIKARSPARGEASARLPVEFKGKPVDIAFNPDFVLDGLKNCEMTPVRLEFRDRQSPGKFKLGEDYHYVVMPITVET
jgi:DNA polymerase-3 subunit beta